MRQRKYRRLPEVEKQIGMTLAQYVRRASEKGLTQLAMAEELGVRETTMGRWIEDLGLRQVRAYVNDWQDR